MSHLYSFEVTQLSIAFPITHEDYHAIALRDDEIMEAISESGERNYDYNKHCLSGILDTIEGVSDADYNGHFGSYIFFNLDCEDDSPEKRVEILTLIMDYIKGEGDFA